MNSNAGTADVLIIGGGLHGCSAALWLGRAGARVTVLEKDQVGSHASSLNAGGVRRLGRVLPEVPLSAAAHALWMNIAQLVDDDCGFESSHQIKVAETEQALDELRGRAALLGDNSFGHEEIIDAAQLRDLLPACAPHLVGGMVVHGDGHADPARTTQAFYRAASASGARFETDQAVRDIKQVDGVWTINTGKASYSAPWLINTAGAWAGDIAQQLQEPVPIRGAALMLSITEAMPSFVRGVVGCQGKQLSFKQLRDGAVMIGGGLEGSADLQTSTTKLDPQGLAKNLQTAIEIFPIMRNAKIARSWAGIEGMLPDAIPVIGASQTHQNAAHAFGFCGHGFQLAPVVGKLIAQLVAGQATELNIDAFSIGRFARKN